MDSKKLMNVAVIGGSLAGLCTGIMFLRLGHNVTIIERRTPSDLQDQGAGINIAPYFPPVVASLKKLGIPSPVFDFLKQYDRTGKPWCRTTDDASVQFLNGDGSVKQLTPMKGLILGTTSWKVLYDILRANFDGTEKMDGDGHARFLHGITVNSLKDLGSEGVTIECVDIQKMEATINADLVIGADGANSTVRHCLYPYITRDYTGYMAWRGTARRDQLSATTLQSLGDMTTATFFYGPGEHALHYQIPGPNGELDDDQLVSNVVWYTNFSNAPEIFELLIGPSTEQRIFTLSSGKIPPDVMATERARAAAVLPPSLAEIVQKIDSPFYQVVSDSLTHGAVFMDGKVILVGEAVAGLRPHISCGATQAALHALLLGDVFQEKSKMSLEQWGKMILRWSTAMQELSRKVGDLGQFGEHPMAGGARSSAP